MSKPPAWVQEYIGKTYELGACGPDSFDCYRLMAVVMGEKYKRPVPLKGDMVPDPSGGRGAFLRAIAGMLGERADWQEVDAPQPGDGILLRHGKHEAHCGLVVAVLPRPAGHPPAGWMLHIHKGINVTCEIWHGPRWGNRVVGFHRYVGAGRYVGGGDG